MAFTDRVVLVAGGCGTVGSGIVQSFLREGARVVVNSRSSDRLKALKKKIRDEWLGRLVLIQEDVSDEAGAERLRDAVLKSCRAIHHVVSSLGGMFQGGPLTKQSLTELNSQIRNLATAHFLVARTFLPLLAEVPDSTYTFITGGAGERCFYKDISLTTVGAACLFGVSLAAQAEFEGNPNLTVNEVRLLVWVQDKMDRSFEGHEFHVGNDLVGNITVAVNKDRLHGIQRVCNRGDAEATIKEHLH